jgi:hypothetical protein
MRSRIGWAHTPHPLTVDCHLISVPLRQRGVIIASVRHTPNMTPAPASPLDVAAELYAQYVELVEISSLAELVQTDDLPDTTWQGPPPVGLVITR